MTDRRRFLTWLLGLLTIEILSWVSFRLSISTSGQISLMSIMFTLIVAVALWLALTRPTWLAWISVAELVLGGKGYLFWGEWAGAKISIRLALFVLLIGAALWHSRRTNRLDFPRQLLLPIGLLLGWVVVMSGVGVVRGFGLGAVFTDMNAYLYIALLWPWWMFLRRETTWQKTLLIVLFAGAAIIGLKSWVMQLLFAQNIPQVTTIYHWIRQTGIGEITLISKHVYRIFFQSQIYTLLGFIVILVGFARHRHQAWWGMAALGSSLGIYLSLSRSLWLGLGVALGGFMIVLVSRKEWRSLQRLGILIPLAIFVWLMTTWALNFPYIITPPGRPSNADAVVARLRSAGSAQASTARANQIPPLLTAIRQNPVTGHGFGATLTYYSTDPRIRGFRTTSAFELGYLDMTFHFGLVGLGLMGWWLWRVWRKIRLHPEAAMWIWPTVALATVHLTSPYLNHPLGLGWLVIVSLIAFDHD